MKYLRKLNQSKFNSGMILFTMAASSYWLYSLYNSVMNNNTILSLVCVLCYTHSSYLFLKYSRLVFKTRNELVESLENL